MVTRTSAGEGAQSIQTVRGVGSSMALSRTLVVRSAIRSASSTTMIRQRPDDGRLPAVDTSSRASSMVMVTFSVRTNATSEWVSPRMVRQAGHSPQPRRLTSSWSQFRAAAKAFAALERPEPGGPVKSHACVSPSPWAAWRSWATTACWPWRSSQTVMRCCFAHGAALGDGQQGFDAFEDPCGEFGNRQAGGQHQIGPGPGRCHVQEGRPDRGVEFVRLGFEAVLGGVACGAPLPADCGLDVEQHGEVRLQARRRPSVDVPDCRGPEAAAGALVRDRGVNVPVSQDDLAALQRGPDHLAGVRGPGGREDQGFRVGIDVAVAVVQHERTQLLADRSAARFPGPQHREAA